MGKSRSNLNNQNDHDSSTSDLALENGGPDLHFEPKAPVEEAKESLPDVTSPSEARSTSESVVSEPDLHFKASVVNTEQKDDIERYDEGSHSDSSQMHEDD